MEKMSKKAKFVNVTLTVRESLGEKPLLTSKRGESRQSVRMRRKNRTTTIIQKRVKVFGEGKEIYKQVKEAIDKGMKNKSFAWYSIKIS